MSLSTVHQHEIITLGSRRFRCPIQTGKSTKLPEGTTWEDLARLEIEEGKEDEYDYDQESEDVDFSDSDSDDGMVAYWLQDAKLAAKTQKDADEARLNSDQNKSSNVGNIQEPDMEESTNVETQQSIIQEEEDYSHLLYIPFHTSNKFKKRCDTFSKQIIETIPGFEPYLTTETSRIDVLPLNLSDFQVDMMQQLMQYGGILEKNVECKTTPCKPTQIGKIKVELRGVEVYKIVDTDTLNQNSSAWIKEAHRGPIYNDHIKNTKYQLSVIKGSGWEKVEEVVNNAIGKLIELGIANDSNLKGARFDISQMMYKLEDPRVNIMEFEDQIDLQDLQKIRKKYETFNFQHADIKQLVFAKIEKSTGEVIPIVTAEIK